MPQQLPLPGAVTAFVEASQHGARQQLDRRRRRGGRGDHGKGAAVAGEVHRSRGPLSWPVSPPTVRCEHSPPRCIRQQVRGRSDRRLPFPLRFRQVHARLTVYENHPVLNALESRLNVLRDQYRCTPNEQNRYQLVRHEQLIAQWAPASLAIA